MRPPAPSTMGRLPDAPPAAKRQKKDKADIEEEMDIFKARTDIFSRCLHSCGKAQGKGSWQEKDIATANEGKHGWLDVVFIYSGMGSRPSFKFLLTHFLFFPISHSFC